MNWSIIDKQDHLNDLDRMVCWEDSGVIELYALNHIETYFPNDISRSGYSNKDVHVFCEVCSSVSPYLYMVWIHCDCYDSSFVENLHMAGSVDSLKRVEILDPNGSVQMRCARLIYRFVSETEVNRDQPYRELSVRWYPLSYWRTESSRPVASLRSYVVNRFFDGLRNAGFGRNSLHRRSA